VQENIALLSPDAIQKTIRLGLDDGRSESSTRRAANCKECFVPLPITSPK
jgi:hypothetical protein